MSQRCEEMLHPVIPIAPSSEGAYRGLDACAAALADVLRDRQSVTVVVECYPGVEQAEVLRLLQPQTFDTVIHADDCAMEPEQLDAALADDLTEDRVFGILTVRKLQDFFLKDRLEAARTKAAKGKRVLIYGVGATLVTEGDVLVYADITRWELQLRFRRGSDNWRTAQHGLPKLSKYKRGYFAEWRWGDKIKKAAFPGWTSIWIPPCRGTLLCWTERFTETLWPRWPSGRSAWCPTMIPVCGVEIG